MGYIDEWGTTPQHDRERLENTCKRKTCTHMRYQHGWAREALRSSQQVTYEPGPCMTCRCPSFCEEPPIDRDEVLALHDWLSQQKTIVDLGIKPIGGCGAQRLSYETGAPQEETCALEGGHKGDHEWRGK